MDYKRDGVFWLEHRDTSGEELARLFGGDGAHWRRAKRTAFPEVPEQQRPLVGVGVWDLHYPKHDKRLWCNILQLVDDIQPDIFLLGGDNDDMETVSHWVENKRRVVEGKRLKRDYTNFNRDVLDNVSSRLKPGARKICHLGNHEDWVNQYLDVHPEMEGFIEIENNWHLDDWELYQYGEVSKMGHLHATHGTYVNIHNAMKTAQVYGRSIMYGHGHSLQSHTLVTPLDSLPYAAFQIPCACNLNPSYRKNQPNAWVTGLAVFYIQPDGQFNLYPVVAIDGKFVAPNGVIYE